MSAEVPACSGRRVRFAGRGFLARGAGLSGGGAANTRQEEFAPALNKARSVVGKGESGEFPPAEGVLADWLSICGIGGRLQTVLLGVARFARMRDGGPVKVWFLGWVDAECNAHTLRVWQPIIFPGLIQTEAYARELYAVAGFSEDQISEYVRSRLSRHAILDRSDPPSVVIVLDEVVLHRLIVSPEVMRGQLAHAVELSKRPNIHIHILPSRTGANAGLGGPIHLATGTGTPEVLLVGALIEDQVTLEPLQVRKASYSANGGADCVEAGVVRSRQASAWPGLRCAARGRA